MLSHNSMASRESPKKHWVFTLNNPISNDDAGLWLLPYEYAVLGNEVGEECGTPHIQGYVVFKKKYRLAQLKAHSTQGGRCHWEPQSVYSTPLQASEYCKKQGRYKEFGELYADYEEFLVTCLFDGYHSDEFAEEEEDMMPHVKYCRTVDAMCDDVGSAPGVHIASLL